MIDLPSPLPARAWQIERAIRLNAVPKDRRVHPGQRYYSDTIFPHGDDLIAMFWGTYVPGSGAPDLPYLAMVQSRYNQGFDVTEAEALIPEGLRLAAENHVDDLRVHTARLLSALHDAPKIPDHPYWQYSHPIRWEDILSGMESPSFHPESFPKHDLYERILNGWLGQLAGGSFGTVIEGYHSSQILKVYGMIDDYLIEPETVNDDVVYELVFLDVFERRGRNLSSIDIGLEWLRQIPFGWSAEWVALTNMSMGLLPPLSGSFRNPYSDWIGAQMRTMICGMLAPGWPLEAARLAFLDSCVSHTANGVYGGMYAAVITSLAFVRNDVRSLLREGLNYLPQNSEYVNVANNIISILSESSDPGQAWQELDIRFEEYNWIHAYPNLAADLFALWYCDGDMTNAFRLLAYAGLDVDCNAGLVGTVLGIMKGTPDKWAIPLRDTLETYLRGKEFMSIRALAQKTFLLALKNLGVN